MEIATLYQVKLNSISNVQYETNIIIKWNKKEIINADKARNLTREPIQKGEIEDLYLTMDKIRKAAQNKKFNYYVYGSMTPDSVIQKLLSLGYKTKFKKCCPSVPNDEDIYYISWDVH